MPQMDDVDRGLAAKIFEEKLRVYEEYLRALCSAIEGGSIPKEEKTRLEFQAARMAMHCGAKHIAAASAAVKELVELACPSGETEGRSGAHSSLLPCLFRVAEAFRKDLYGDSFEFDEELEREALENFSAACRNVKDAELWDAAVQRWKDEGWNIEGPSSEHDGFKLTSAGGNPAVIDVGFYDGYYYIQAQYGADTDFSKPLKWKKGGYRKYGTWWQELEAPYGRMAEGTFVNELKSNRELQQYIIQNTDELKEIASIHHRAATWKEAIGEYDNWTMFIWYWGTLACDLALEEEGTPYLDILKDEENGNVAIWLSNRNDDALLLNRTLRRIGLQDKEIVGCSALLEVVPPSVGGAAIPGKVREGLQGKKIEDCLPSSVADAAVPERIRHWIEKIGAGARDLSAKEGSLQESKAQGGRLKDFAAIDFETANGNRSSVCSVGVVIVRDGAIADKFYSLIRPEPNYYWDSFTEIHGLTAESTKDAPLFPEVWGKAAALIGELPLVAHNSAFDEGCLKAAFAAYGMDYPGYTFYCTCRAARRVFAGLPNHKLPTVAKHCGYDLQNHHEALADAEACARIAIRIL